MMESLKEIAQRLAPNYWKRAPWNAEYFDSVGFAEALIESYKAELLKEVGEPFGFYYEINGTWDAFVVGETEPDDDVYDEGSLKALFTSDQLAAAILKATKPLEEEVVKWREASRVKHIEAIDWAGKHQAISYQLAAAKEEINDWRNQAHQSQSAFERAQDQLAKYRDAPVVAWSHLVKGLTFVETYAGSKPLIVKPGE